MAKSWKVLVLGVLAVVLLSVCGPGAVENIGDAMVEVGSALRDGSSDDAAAQDCATCTAGGAGRSVVASEDVDRLVSGSTAAGVSSGVEIISGPFVLEHAAVSAADGTAAQHWLFVSTEATCGTGDGADWVSRIEVGSDFDGRFAVPAGARLCVRAASGFTVGEDIGWSGFRPYD